ncbi:hemagglutinin repeat-containing protein [Stenotrophomonas sp. LMG 10879]|uniref:hemagglutinin repeat-containing protein n=3 Tax=unclassified Stenotrophomonas TaxID=196198 RepID=UPI0024345D78|nr:hemagglutinin repeat-containing protein [Stenotrophomonas sp. LMG 10879]
MVFFDGGVSSHGSTIQGGGNVNLTSTTGDIHVVQGNLSAGNTLSLDSAGDILLEAGKAHVADHSKSSNAGPEVGVGVVVGAQTGVYVYAEASVGSSKSNSDSNTWQNTTLTGQHISLKAEGDTTLRGATATADRIDVKTGGTLTIESLQDMAESMSKNSQVGGRVQVAFGNAWNADGYASAGKAEGSYQGVGQQSGLFAGNGGYHVDAGHVNLIGGAISSTNAANSELTAQTLTFSDLQNQMDYSASSGSISGGAGGQMKGWDPKAGTTAPRGGPGMSMSESGGDSSSTLATLTEGSITIGGKQTTAAELGINTDASAAHRALEALPDASKLLADQQAMAGAIGTVVATSRQVANDIQTHQSNKATQDYYDSLSPEEQVAFDKLDAKARDKRLSDNSQAYKDAKKWGSGGDYSRALDAVTTALVGSAGGQAVGQLASNALAPYAAFFIGSTFDPNHGKDPNATMQLLSHALLGAVLAEVNGAGAGAGAAAAVGGEVAAKFLTDTLYGGNASKLSPQEKGTILALSQAVGALAGGLSGQDLAGIALNAGIAKNSAENNFLGQNDHARMIHLREKAKRQGGLDKQESLELVLLDAGDQMSAGLLRKALAGENLSEVQAADLATYISRYESQNGPLDLPELQKQFQERAGTLRPGELQGVNPSQAYERPYAGLGDDQKAYKDANYSWVEDIFYRKKGANERLFENALRKSGLEPSRTEDLLPSSMQLRNYFAIQDAQTSSAMASIAFVAATVGDMSEDNRRALTLTMGGIANIAGIAISGKTGLLPQTGGLGVTRSPSRRRVSEAPAINALSVEQPKNQGGDSGGSSTKNFIPPGPVRVSDAHSVETIGAGTRFGGGNRNTLKSVLMGGDDIDGDIREINSGQGILLPDGNVAVSSGRVWGAHPGSATMFPRSGPGIVQLSQAEFRLYRDMVRQNGMSSSIEKALDGMISVGNSGVSSESRSKLNELYRSRDLGK